MAWGYIYFSDSAKLTKVRLTTVSEANDYSCISAHTCVSKVIDFIEERIPIVNSNTILRAIILSDGYTSQSSSY